MQMFLLYIRELYNFSKSKIVLNLFLMVVLGLTEGIGVMMLIPFFSLAGITSGGQATNSNLALWLEQIFNSVGLPLNLTVVLALYTGIIFGQSWLQRYQSVLNNGIQQSYTSFLSIRLFKAIAYANWSFLLSKAKSDIAHVVTSELMRVSSGTAFFLQMIATLLIAMIQISIAFVISPGLTAMALGGGIVLFGCMQSFVRKSRQMGMDISNFNRNLFFEVTEHLNGIKEVKSYSIEGKQVENFARVRNNIADNFIKFNKMQSQTDLLYKVGAAVFISIFFYSAIEIFKLGPQEFLLIIIIFARLWPRFSSFQVALQYVVMMLPAFQVVTELEKQCIAAREFFPQKMELEKMPLNEGVEFRHVSFSYDGGGARYALKDVNVKLTAGNTIAFTGVSGAGKSTLVDLLIGLLTPSQGEILIDGAPLSTNVQGWRQSIGYVPQDAFLFNSSIKENLRWSYPDAEEVEIWEALKMAAVDEFVRSLPEGLDTLVGDRGVRLSGGERQRIVLARALLRKPTLLILDEATSALDMENEKRIQQAIESLHGKLIIVIIAHRLSTIKNADLIYVMEDGCIVEQGNYQGLSKDANSRFYTLAQGGS